MMGDMSKTTYSIRQIDENPVTRSQIDAAATSERTAQKAFDKLQKSLRARGLDPWEDARGSDEWTALDAASAEHKRLRDIAAASGKVLR